MNANSAQVIGSIAHKRSDQINSFKANALPYAVGAQCGVSARCVKKRRLNALQHKSASFGQLVCSAVVLERSTHAQLNLNLVLLAVVDARKIDAPIGRSLKAQRASLGQECVWSNSAARPTALGFAQPYLARHSEAHVRTARAQEIARRQFALPLPHGAAPIRALAVAVPRAKRAARVVVRAALYAPTQNCAALGRSVAAADRIRVAFGQELKSAVPLHRIDTRIETLLIVKAESHFTLVVLVWRALQTALATQRRKDSVLQSQLQWAHCSQAPELRAVLRAAVHECCHE